MGIWEKTYNILESEGEPKKDSTDWRGYVVEAKSIFNYPKCGKWYFWSRFPVRFIKFYWNIFIEGRTRRW